MATPNQMPKKPSKLSQQLLAAMIETKPSSWQAKSLVKDAEGKEVVETVKVNNTVLKYPLAQNMSELAVEAASRRLIK